MNLPLKIALRYLFSFRRFHFITFITMVSVVGIVIGVAALIIVMSIFNGFGNFTKEQLIGYDPHVRILPQSGNWIDDYRRIDKELSRLKNIDAYSPVVEGRMIITKNDNMKVINLFGYDVQKFYSVSGIDNNMIDGVFRIIDFNNKKNIVLGSGLAYLLKVRSEDIVHIMTFKDVEASITLLSRQPGMPMLVSGIFSTNNPEYDDSYGYTSLENAAHLLKAPANAVTAVDIRLKSVDDSENMKSTLESIFPDFEILTWYDLHQELYTVLKFERLAVFVILSLIIVIAVFNVLASLSMTVVEKRPDIGILKALGANDVFIRRTYLYLGLLIGFISTTLGTIIGLAVSFGQIHFEWIKLNSSQYLVSALPLSVSWLDVILVIVVSLTLSFVATIYPAKRAASTLVVEAVRED